MLGNGVENKADGIVKASISVKQQQQQAPPKDVSTRPLFNLDVDIGKGRNERLVVFASDSPKDIATRFVQKYNLDVAKVRKCLLFVCLFAK